MLVFELWILVSNITMDFLFTILLEYLKLHSVVVYILIQQVKKLYKNC